MLTSFSLRKTLMISSGWGDTLREERAVSDEGPHGPLSRTLQIELMTCLLLSEKDDRFFLQREEETTR